MFSPGPYSGALLSAIEFYRRAISFTALLSCHKRCPIIMVKKKCIVMVINQLRQEACVPRGPRVYDTGPGTGNYHGRLITA